MLSLNAGRAFLATRSVLNDDDREIYDILHEGVKGRCKSVVFQKHVDLGRVERVCLRILADVPGLFWLSKNLTASYYGERTVVAFHFLYDADEISAYQRLITHRLEQLFDDRLSGCTTEYEYELAVHDFLAMGVVYNDTGDPSEHNIIGPLVNGSATCEGITHAFNFIMNSVGVNCVSVYGEEDGVNHMWNIVMIDDTPYHVDVTHDLGGSHAFFNVTDGELSGTRIWKTWLRCSSSAMNYYVVNGTLFTDSRMLRKYLKSRCKSERTIEFRIEPDPGIGWVEKALSDCTRVNRASIRSQNGTYLIRMM